MKALVISEFGEAEKLVLREIPTPEPHGPEVRIRVAAVGLNRADILQRKGFYPAPPGFDPRIPGLEYAGIVESTGPDCQLRMPGERVMGLVGGGACAEYLVVHERETIRVPENLSLLEAAAVPEAFLTAYDAIFLQGGLQAGEWCLIRAATSGVGIAACQLVRALGSRSLGTSRSSTRLEALEQHGLDVGLLQGRKDFLEAVQSATRGQEVAVVLDLLGARHLEENLQVLRTGGTLMVVGLMAGRKDELDLGLLLRKRLTVRGTVLRSRSLEEKIALARIFEQRLVPLFETGALAPTLDQSFDLENAAHAHERMESNEHLGKILLQVDQKLLE